MFIRAKNGEYINSDDIVRLRAGMPRDIGGPRCLETTIAALRDGTYAELPDGDEVNDVAAKLTPVLPATAGFEALWTVEYEDDPVIGIIRHPVLGWREDPYSGLLPVTLDDEKYVSNVHFAGVKYPDGQFVVPACARYDSEKEWFEEVQNEARERRVKPVDPFGEPA